MFPPRPLWEIKQEKLSTIAIFCGVAVLIVIICFAWFQREKRFDKLEQTRISVYRDLSRLVEKMISASNQDSLATWRVAFEQQYYDGRAVSDRDTSTQLAIRRFKYELDDRLNGTLNILDPSRFIKSGHDIIQSCELEMSKLSKGDKEIA
ncbi:MAG TPA: hypothetical protein VKR32_13745, partial [Puia sp.]|nr:hypothetical protein [Puia sp.]